MKSLTREEADAILREFEEAWNSPPAPIQIQEPRCEFEVRNFGRCCLRSDHAEQGRNHRVINESRQQLYLQLGARDAVLVGGRLNYTLEIPHVRGCIELSELEPVQS